MITLSLIHFGSPSVTNGSVFIMTRKNLATKIKKQHLPAAALATAFFILATIYSIVTPLFEALDEVWHYPFVWHLAQTWELPVQDPANVQLWRQEASQPPLYYGLAALLTSPVAAGDLPQLIYRNPHADLGVVMPDGNINMIIHTQKEAWPWRGAALAVHLARLLSVLLATGTVLAVYALGRTLWPQQRRLALLAMAFVAFNPMFLFVAGSVNNDNLVTLLAALVLWQLVKLVTQQPTRAEPSLGQFIILGVLLGLAALSKLSGLGLLGLAGLTLLGWGWRQRSWRVAILGNVIITLLAVTIAGWWYWRNITLYGDWSGTQNMVAMMGPRTVTPTMGQLLAELPGMMRSFWGLFGGLSLPMPVPVYWGLNLLLLAGVAGLLLAGVAGQTKRLPPRLLQSWPILMGWLILLIIGLVQWTLRTPATQGRLLFPGLAALATLWAAGWLAWTPRWLQIWPAVALFGLAAWVPWGIIGPAYALPRPVEDIPATAQPVAASFGEAAQLVAFQNHTATVQPGQAVSLTLYWRGQQSMATDYSIFIHLLDQNDLIIAQRDLYHGLGLYPTSQWPAGIQFADTYTIRIPRTAFAPAQARFAVGLYNHATGARLPVSSGGDTVYFGSVTVQPPPGQYPNPQDLLFEDGIALVGYSIDTRLVARNERLNLTLYWQSKSRPVQNYKVFVHLVADGDVRAAQHDSEPQNGAAPTSSWQTGQTIIDQHPLTIAPDTPPGVYRVVVGLYNGRNGDRLRVLQDHGVSVQANAVTLSNVRVVLP